MLCRRLATCILQQCRRRRGRILLQWLDGAPHRRVVTTDQCSEALFHASSGRRRSAWRHARSRWTPGTAAVADAAWCAEQRRRRQPLQQVASSVCSLSVSSTSVTQPCSTCMPSTTSDSRRKATYALVIQERPGKVSGGNVRLSWFSLPAADSYRSTDPGKYQRARRKTTSLIESIVLTT